MDNPLDINSLTENLHIHCTPTIDIIPDKAENETTLIARIVTQKIINMNAFKATLLKAWNPNGKVISNILNNNTAAFIFEDVKDYDKVMNQTWTFRDHLIITASWPQDKALDEIDLNTTPFWIQASGIPVNCITTKTAIVIGDSIGRFIKTDLNSANQRWKKALRVQVHLDIQKPLMSNMVLSINGRTRILMEIRYERLTEICFNCGKIGHKIPNCEEIIDEKEKENANLGPWLRAENTHIPNPKFNNFKLPVNGSTPINFNRTGDNFSGQKSSPDCMGFPNSHIKDCYESSVEPMCLSPPSEKATHSLTLVQGKSPTPPPVTSDKISNQKAESLKGNCSRVEEETPLGSVYKVNEIIGPLAIGPNFPTLNFNKFSEPKV
ncbi:hypothetical protein CASFOL_015112 [Castilleja foliolosa]|uniref:CCHC-type domain-containing protein n=1 Tax=Castilleja foliolosa TaxID=1961234 RepID=A0ABD3DG66_9LAMI